MPEMNYPHPLIIAHRGARAHAPENTLAAARLAYAAKADMWELDTCLTKDGYLVVVHDATLERTTDVAKRPEFADRVPWRVDAFTLTEIRSLDAGSWFGECDSFGTVASGEVPAAMLTAYAGEKIPTLEEALQLTKALAWRVNVEIKTHYGAVGHETVARLVAERIRSLGMEEAVVVSSFQHTYLRESAVLLPSVSRGALTGKSSKPEELEAAHNAGFSVAPSLSVDEAVHMCGEAHAVFFHPEKSFLDAAFVRAVQEKGIGINVWTVNTPEDMLRMLDYGVRSIITDFPARLATMLP